MNRELSHPTPLLTLLLLLWLALPAHGQIEPGREWELPTAVATEIVRKLNDPAVEVREGSARIGPDSIVAGDLLVLDGSLTLEGAVQGSVTVVHGEALLAPGAWVGGDLVVVGGSAEGLDQARIAGEIAIYAARLPYERSGGRFRLVRTPRIAPPRFDRSGASDFLITTGKSYNRVEGLPIAFGPRLRTEGSNPLQIQALAIYRSTNGLRLNPDEMGYFVQADQYLGGRREFVLGASMYSLVDPIEEWQLSDLESGLATFLLHQDYRDHYQRQGASLFGRWEVPGSYYRVQLESRWENHDALGTGTPWSLFGDADEWRPQPVIAEGRFGSVRLEGIYDSRGSIWNPAAGWYLRGALEQTFRADLEQPLLVPAPEEPEVLALGGRAFGHFLTGHLDMRSYNRIDPGSRLNLRLLAGGSLTGAVLPPQRQYALGGEGSLPGYPLFSSDCGARGERVAIADRLSTEGEAFFPAYGCDAFALLQAEFRGKLAFRFRWDVGPWREDRDSGDRVWDFGWDLAPDWAIFVDAGRGWAFGDRQNAPTAIDVGAGILLERVGLYLALPVTGGRGVNLFVRLGPRF